MFGWFKRKPAQPVTPGGDFSQVGDEAFAGLHILVDLWGVHPRRLSEPHSILRTLERAAEAAGATILFSNAHSFEGGGVSAVVILAESHITIHTWPERGVATLDVFMCGKCLPSKTLSVFRDHFRPEAIHWQEIKRASTKIEKNARTPVFLVGE